tara:strand:- start:248 stop:652 length:405 start_codon:yes stop_codon:yes gene_type:complete
MKAFNKGFTLIEIMVVVAIIGILAAIAYPSYSEYVKRGNRAEGQAFLSDAAARQERYYSQNNAYADTVKKLYGEDNRSSQTEKYTLGVASNANDGGYTLTASAQFVDANCGNLSLNAMGVRGETGAKDVDYCWK